MGIGAGVLCIEHRKLLLGQQVQTAEAAADSEEDAPAESNAEPEEDLPSEITILEGATLTHFQMPETQELSPRMRSAFAAAYEDDDLDGVLTANPSRVKAPRRLWLKILIPVLALALLATFVTLALVLLGII